MGIDRITAVRRKTGVIHTESRRRYNLGAGDPLLEHARRGRYLDVTTVNRGTDRFEVYDTDGTTRLADGERIALSAIN